ncbi:MULTISPECIES: hypothetical protein [Brasilonema]|uniref:hypothetical protein n=1 Tax=Brasilonema TaxID=383614 RepID=UPI00145F4D69|nr:MULTISPECIES: hypothetical protein [Brasilonema]
MVLSQENHDYWFWSRPGILEKLSQLTPRSQVIVLRSPKAVRQFLQDIPRSLASPENA